MGGPVPSQQPPLPFLQIVFAEFAIIDEKEAVLSNSERRAEHGGAALAILDSLCRSSKAFLNQSIPLLLSPPPRRPGDNERFQDEVWIGRIGDVLDRFCKDHNLNWPPPSTSNEPVLRDLKALYEQAAGSPLRIPTVSELRAAVGPVQDNACYLAEKWRKRHVTGVPATIRRVVTGSNGAVSPVKMFMASIAALATLSGVIALGEQAYKYGPDAIEIVQNFGIRALETFNQGIIINGNSVGLMLFESRTILEQLDSGIERKPGGLTPRPGIPGGPDSGPSRGHGRGL